MTVNFERMRADGWDPIECAAIAESQGMSRLDVFKAIYTCWGPDAFAVTELEKYGTTEYPSRAARAAATVGLAVIILNYAHASYEEVAKFERVTGISRKVEALARADRSTDALSFYDRLDPNSLELTPTSETEARATVRAARARYSHFSSVVVDSVTPYSWGWLFSPDLGFEHGSRRPPQPGADVRPIIFDRFTGVAIVVSSNEPEPVYVQRYEESGWPDPTDPTSDTQHE